MTEQSAGPTHEQLAERVAALESEREHARRFAGFVRLYPAFAVALVAVSFLPLYDPLVQKEDGVTMRWTFGSIWQLLGSDNSGVSTIGIMLFFAVAALLMVAASVRNVPVGVLVANVVLSLIIILLVALKPAMPDPPPEIGYGGEAGIGVLALIALCSAAHVWMLVRDRLVSAD